MKNFVPILFFKTILLASSIGYSAEFTCSYLYRFSYHTSTDQYGRLGHRVSLKRVVEETIQAKNIDLANAKGKETCDSDQPKLEDGPGRSLELPLCLSWIDCKEVEWWEQEWRVHIGSQEPIKRTVSDGPGGIGGHGGPTR